MTTDHQAIIHAYRRLYRSLLQAVQYATPARYIARDQLRAAFREPDATLDPEGIKRTVWFLQAASKERGLEHKILKNLIEVQGRRVSSALPWPRALSESRRKKDLFASHKRSAYDHFDMTVAMLNKTMGLCLRLDSRPKPRLPSKWSDRSR
ncbi:hypothetical protein ACRE_078120 [Hapsidospora chrysogenum ATCC 11550]|uniref:Uncharacterized protein n=1 Tax=Hapsidospora chrysogenum (strain ATCC 11550 / CBS 779.69 / DSM 880 / IAM 14645 / JCM 23072 / IMI 49137) TaxID=857340 RepID=A0A086SWI7_HAPC1|nr:hypothetical protein ACRE_078120 [Hapsidospora chrysogenum ATCC 11550]